MAWGERPVPSWVALAIGALIVVAPSWLMSDQLLNFRLKGDDFAFIDHSRTWARTSASLWVTHFSHVVPLFRLWTFALVRVAGDLANLPTVIGLGSYSAMVLVMVAGGYFVARETGDGALGLVAMALLGTTTVVEPGVIWYAAGQTFWAGLGILAMLVALQGWRRSGGTWRLVLAALAAIAAPAFWTAGYAAGPVGAAYLWADGRPRCRRVAALPILASALVAASFFAVSGRQIIASMHDQQHKASVVINPLRGLSHTSQAIPEALIFGNLGLDAETDATQGVVFCLALVGLWAWSRRRAGFRPSPLEAAGAMLILSSFAMIFTFRSYLPYSSLRSTTWYHVIPHIGFVLLAVGWWAGPSSSPPPPRSPVSRRGALFAVGLVGFLLLAHQARAQRVLTAAVDEFFPWEESEKVTFPTAKLERLRAVYFASVLAERQRQTLARLDRAEAIARRLNIGRETIRRTMGRIDMPGLSERFKEASAVDLLDLPERGTTDDPAVVRSALGTLLEPVPDAPRPWLDPSRRWPP
jgi:hypothetical protein